MKEYPENYKGPKAGQSEDVEWIAIRDYQAFKWVADGTWTYSDFDCYFYTLCKHHYKLGEDSVHKALIEFQKI